VLVDPEVLRAFAGQVDIAASAIAAANIGPTTTSAADGIADSTTQWAAPTVGEQLLADCRPTRRKRDKDGPGGTRRG